MGVRGELRSVRRTGAGSRDLGVAVSFTNLKIAHKLGLAFAAVITTIVVMTAVIFWNLQRLEDAVYAEDRAGTSIDIITNAQFRLARQENSYRGFLLTNNGYYLERLAAHRAAFDAHLTQLRQARAGHEGEAEIAAQLDAATAAMDTWQREVVDEGVTLFANPIFRYKVLDMIGPDGQADQHMSVVEDAMDALLEYERAESASAIQLRDAATVLTERVLYVGVGIAVVIAIMLGYFLTRMIASPVTSLTGVMGRLASGDNAVEVPAVDRGDEIGEMAKAV
ncbi:HAMP domain-containing protein, partial [Mesorhizobium microcysteis]